MGATLTGWWKLLVSLAGIGALTFICFRIVPSSPVTAALLLLLLVVVTALTTRQVFGIVAALVATVCLDVFFLPPIGSIRIADPQNWVALLTFCSLSVVSGQLSNRLRAQRDELLMQQHETERLHALSRSLLLSGSGEEMRRLLVNECSQLFELTGFVLFESLSQVFHRAGTDCEFPADALRQAKEKNTVRIDGCEWNVVPVRLGNLVLGSMAFTRPTPLPPATINSWAGTVALGLAQVQAQETASRMAAVRRSEELKSVMIDALAHDLKTPLTAMEAAASMLADPAPLSKQQADDMVAVIQEEVHGLRQLVEEAIHLARIDAKKLKLQMGPEPPGELIGAALRSLGEKGGSGRIQMTIPAGLPPVLADSELIVQALKQLLDNALKYSPPRSPVSISAAETDGVLTFFVRDSGPGLTELEQSRVFEKFYRGRYDRSAVQGTGMGLAIAREIAEAHGGSVGVRSYVGQGTEFFLSLKTAPAFQHQKTA